MREYTNIRIREIDFKKVNVKRNKRSGNVMIKGVIKAPADVKEQYRQMVENAAKAL